MRMFDSNDLSARAAELAEEVLAAVKAGAPSEGIEAILLSALGEVVVRERERCASIAEERARMWRGTKLNDPSWPAEGRREAQERYKEATAIADAIRAGTALPPLV